MPSLAFPAASSLQSLPKTDNGKTGKKYKFIGLPTTYKMTAEQVQLLCVHAPVLINLHACLQRTR